MILKRNDHSTNVALWQGFLVSLGYDNVKPDSHFGPYTERATQSFQNANGLRGDGIVGDNTVKVAKEKGFAGFTASTEGAKKAIAKLVLVSAGHTNKPGQDMGAAGNGYIEGVEAVRIRDAVAGILLGKGVHVIEDGADGKNEPLTKAISLAKTADVAVEIHFNAGPAAATGIECLAKPKHRLLARKLSQAVADATGLTVRGGDGGYKADNSGQHHRLGFCEAGGVILEICFISNAGDMVRYHEHFDQMVKNIAEVLAV